MTTIDFGWWKTKGGRRSLLTWDPTTGALTLDGDPITYIRDEDDLRRRLDGWAFHCDLPDGLGWVAQQLNGRRT